MMTFRMILAGILLLAGVFCVACSLIGSLRIHDFLCRLQTTGIGSALGVICCCLGFAIYEGLTFVSLKILFVGFLLLLTGPMGTHIIAKVAIQQATGRFVSHKGSCTNCGACREIFPQRKEEA